MTHDLIPNRERIDQLVEDIADAAGCTEDQARQALRQAMTGDRKPYRYVERVGKGSWLSDILHRMRFP